MTPLDESQYVSILVQLLEGAQGYRAHKKRIMAPTALMRRVDMPQAVTARSLDWASTLSIIFSPGTVNGGSVDIVAVVLQMSWFLVQSCRRRSTEDGQSLSQDGPAPNQPTLEASCARKDS